MTQWRVTILRMSYGHAKRLGWLPNVRYKKAGVWVVTRLA